MAGYRLKATVLGIAAIPGDDRQLLTLQGDATFQTPNNQFAFLMPAADASSFSIGQAVFMDIALSAAEQTTIAGADPVTPFDTTN